MVVASSTGGCWRLLSSATSTLLLLSLLQQPNLHLAIAFSKSSTSSIDKSSSSSSSPTRIRSLSDDGSANRVLYNLLLQQQQQQQKKTNFDDDDDEPSTLLVLEGYISKRRAIGKHLIFLDVIPVNKLPTLETYSSHHNNSNNKKQVATTTTTLDGSTLLEKTVPVQAVMRREFWKDNNNITTTNNNNNNNTTSPSPMSSFDVYYKIIQPGTYCRIQGQVGPSRNPNEAMIFCHTITYTLANNNPQHLRNVLKFVHEGLLDAKEVMDALPILSHVDELSSLTLQNDNNSHHYQPYGELARNILERFPPKFLRNPSQLMGSSHSAKVRLLPPVPFEFGSPPPPSQLVETSSDSDSSSNVGTKLLMGQHDNDEVIFTISQAIQNHRNNDHQVRSKDQQPIIITITGWIQNRRRYQESVSVLEVVDEFSSLASSSSTTGNDMDDTDEEDNDDGSSSENSNEMDIMRKSNLKDLWKKRIYAVLHPNALIGTTSHRDDDDDDDDNDDFRSVVEMAEMYGNILSSGARVTMQGFMMSPSSDDDTNNDDGNAATTFWVTKCRLQRSSWRPSDVRHLLDLVHDGKFDIEEAAGALEIPYSQVEDLAKGTTSAAERQWLAAEVTQSLQGENSRVGKISNSMMQSLTTFANARDEYPIQDVDVDITFSNQLDDNGSKKIASTILLESSHKRTSLEDSRWQQKKRPQIQFMVEQISTVLRSHPDYGKRKLNVVDIGGGKGLLSNLLAETFGEDVVDVQVIDISRSATANGMMRAKRRGLGNIRFDAMDATKVDVQSNKDVVVALHACGALSDVALGHAVSQGAAFVIVPCCFRSNPHLRVSIPKGDNNGSREVELVTAEEFLGVDPDQYTPLKQLAELQGDIKLASKAMHTINALRALAVDRLWKKKTSTRVSIHTSIKTFPIGFSTRNFCLVGQYDKPHLPNK